MSHHETQPTVVEHVLEVLTERTLGKHLQSRGLYGVQLITSDEPAGLGAAEWIGGAIPEGLAVELIPFRCRIASVVHDLDYTTPIRVGSIGLGFFHVALCALHRPGRLTALDPERTLGRGWPFPAGITTESSLNLLSFGHL